MYYKNKQKEIDGRQTQQVLHPLAGLEARISAKTQKIPQMTYLTKSLFAPSPKKQSMALTISTISNIDNEFNKFVDEHQILNINLDDNKRAK